MSRFLIEYILKLMEVDQEIQTGLMSIFLIKYFLKAYGSRPGNPEMTYEYIPHSISFESLRK